MFVNDDGYILFWICMLLPSEFLSIVDTSSSPPSSPAKATRVHVQPPTPLTQATTSLPPEVTSLSSVVPPLINSEPTETGNYNSVLPGDTITNALLLNSTSVSTSSSRTSCDQHLHHAPREGPSRNKIRNQQWIIVAMTSEKRKASSDSDITSLSSHHVAKTTRTVRGEAIS